MVLVVFNATVSRGGGSALLVAITLLVGSCGGTSPYAEVALRASFPLETVYFVIDTSGSMADVVSRSVATSSLPKIESAQRALQSLTSILEPEIEIGIRSYPAAPDEECPSGRLDLALGQHDRATIDEVIAGLVADGRTPTAEALEAAAEDIVNHGRPVTVVLLSDGESNCDNPCAVVERLNMSTDWRIITVGFDISAEGADELRCIARATGGKYVSAADSTELEAAFSDPDRLFSVTN